MEHTATEREELLAAELARARARIAELEGRGVADRTGVEAALRRSEEQFKRVIDVSPIPYALCDGAQNVIYLNPAFVRVFGYELADVPTLGDWWPKAYPDPAYREWVATTWLARLEKAREEGNTALEPLEVNICCKDGARRTSLASAASLGDDFSGVYLVLLYDITERMRAEEERRALEQQANHAQRLESLGVLAGGIAHDFNNMLQAILGNAEVALCELQAGSSARRAVEEVVLTAKTCAGLTTQMLAYSGKGKFVVEQLDVSQLVQGMHNLLRTSVHKNTTLALELPAQARAISADASQLGQVLLNLVINGGEAIGERPGRVTISVREARCPRQCPCRALHPAAREWPDRDVVTLAVTDTGVGMDAATLARIFEPFFSTKFAGRGLGLAAVQGILRGHDAGLEVESAPGRGTTFRVHFPAQERLARTRPGASPTEGGWRGYGTVLFVDDEQALRRLGRTALEAHGFTVVTAADDVEAMALFAQHEAAVVCAVLDLVMPGLGGLELRAALRKRRPDLPILLISGYGAEVLGPRHEDVAACAFLQKPFSLSALAEKVRALVDA